ncbi:hypothetical protein PVAND_012489 [Polypedilum vanderplanki]|uniref:Protein sleepless n=1 Tax=Polypedilum vanderplanki TaxID=319348 RepID=A0A9J6CLS8_POLVA|nr:hypothetical protein PVAND_012489 [Polypedilum vanderplanki]
MQVFLKILTIALSISVVFGIYCYDCNSKFDPRCDDEFVPYSLGQVNCDEKTETLEKLNKTATFCRKIRQKVNEQVRIIRSCGFISDEIEEEKCRRTSPSKGVEIISCECKGEKCNGSQRQNYANFYTLTISTIIYSVSNRIFL